MEVDLHTHSIYSDGDLSPKELLELAHSKNIHYYALTDHDTTDGVKELIKQNSYKDITIYSGIELSAEYEKGQMHILGYNFDYNNERLNNRLAFLKERNVNNMKAYLTSLKEKYNIIFSEEENNYLLNKPNVHRPDLALILVKNNYASSVADAFDKYLKDSKMKKEFKGLSKEECLSLIKEAGGISILAHPWSLNLSNIELKHEIEYLISKGLNGIEIYHSGTTKKQHDFYVNLAKEFNLITTGGSDYHGKTIKPDISLGSGRNNLNIKAKDINFISKVTSRY